MVKKKKKKKHKLWLCARYSFIVATITFLFLFFLTMSCLELLGIPLFTSLKKTILIMLMWGELGSVLNKPVFLHLESNFCGPGLFSNSARYNAVCHKAFCSLEICSWSHCDFDCIMTGSPTSEHFPVKKGLCHLWEDWLESENVFTDHLKTLIKRSRSLVITPAFAILSFSWKKKLNVVSQSPKSWVSLYHWGWGSNH